MSFIQIRVGSDSRKIEFPNGTVLTDLDGQRYRLGSAVRSGGNGVVFKATRLGPYNKIIGECAIKLLKQLDEVRRDRFANEIRILKALEHQCIASHYGSGVLVIGDPQISIPWVAMDLGGINLREEIEARGPLLGDNLIAIGIQACRALDCLHEKSIIHRDLKPQNLVFRNAETDDLMMIDFGIAKYVGEDVAGRPMDQFTATMEYVGPVFFASPELIEYARNKNHPLDQRSDIFQLGKVLWFLATNTISAGVISKNRDPFAGKLWNLCMSMLQDDPNERPATAKTVENELQAF